MAKYWANILNISTNVSGAAAAARQGHVVMIVDVIDMSTTAESALEAGAMAVLGASPDKYSAPVKVDPEKIGYVAAQKAIKNNTEVVIAAEPRLLAIKQQTSLQGIQCVLKGITSAGGTVDKVVSNLGKDVVQQVDFTGKILVIVSAAGGVAFDAAYSNGASVVITGTIARTKKMKGDQSARKAAERALNAASIYQCGITVVAASANAMEDVLAANYISQEIINSGFLKIDSETK